MVTGGLTAHGGARRPTRGRGGGLLESCTQRNAKGRTDCKTDFNPKFDVVECNANAKCNDKSKTDSRADGNAHADGILTFLAIGQVGPPMQSSTTTTMRM